MWNLGKRYIWDFWKTAGQVGPRRIGFYRNRISTGNQNHHSVSGSPEPDFLKIRFRSGRTGFQNLTGFRPDFIIWLDYYRISKFSRIPTGIQKFWQCLSLEGGKEWDVSWFIEVTLTHKRISIRSLGGGAANHVLMIQLSIIQVAIKALSAAQYQMNPHILSARYSN